MKILTKTLLTLFAIFVTFATATAQTNSEYKIHKYNTNDGGILIDITPNGKWAVIILGSTQAGGTATPKLYNVDTEEVIPVEYANRTFNISSVSDDGNIVVGSYSGRPAAYNRETGKITLFPIRNLWQSGSLSHVTPDGKWAVGSYNGYNGKLNENDELNHDYYYSTLYVNVETGDTIATPNLPKKDMAHLDQHAMVFRQITPDGRYIIGSMSWYIMQPNSAVTFIYDTQNQNYRVVGFTENDNANWTPSVANLHHLEGQSISPDGHWLAGMAYMAMPIEGSDFYSEFGYPYRYDITTGDFQVLDQTESNIDGCVIDNKGTIIANPNVGGPLRDFRILYQDKYWITLSQICRQQYGFSFTEKTGYERTGSITAVSGDGTRIVAFPDPLGESYIFDFGQSVEDVCNGIDLLDNYTISPVDGSVFSQLSSIEINFGRSVQVLGTGKNVHLYKADGTKVADGLTAGNQGLSLKTGSKTTVNAVFRTRNLDDGESYYVVIDAGAIAVANDAERTNKEIRINYTGRKNGPVEFVKASPEDHSQIRQIDASSSYILVTFDSPVKLTNNYSAYIERIVDGTRMATLTMNEGNTDATKNQVLLLPSSTIYLYDGLEYKVVIEAGSVSDYSGAEISYNSEITLHYHGTYIREVSNDAVLFADDFSDPSASYVTWLRFEGDHNTPLASMQNWQFDADNMPWQFGMADDTNYTNIYAASHSLYAPSGQSDDWMMTPQILMPEDGKTLLDFDAQSYMSNKTDVLKVYVYEQDFEIPVLNSAWMNDDDGVRKNAVLLDEITLSAGNSQEITEGEWTHYRYDLSAWAGKNIYVAFVNQNTNQSAIFIDNVSVQHEILYTIGFSNADRVIGQDDITIAGQFTVKTADPVSSISLILKDSEGNEVSKVEWPTISGNVKDRAIPFTFATPLSLQKGKDNQFTIDVNLGERHDVYKGSIINLAFETTKHVVLEEMTGIECPNCPQGIIVIEKLEKLFGEQFIPVSIHTYTGDPYAGNLQGYTTFLDIIGAPYARINRIPGLYAPMYSTKGIYFDTYPNAPVWYDIVAQELNKLTIADLSLTATQSEDGKYINYQADLRYALNADNQQLSLFLVVMENGIVDYQRNNLGVLSQELFGEWGAGGSRSGVDTNGYVYPVTHNDVARMVIGQTMSGTRGLFPSSLEAGKTYSTTLSSPYPAVIADVNNASVVAMLIDSESGEIINAAKTNVAPYDPNAIRELAQPEDALNIYSLSGVLVRKAAQQSDIKSLPAGLYIIGGKKVLVR